VSLNILSIFAAHQIGKNQPLKKAGLECEAKVEEDEKDLEETEAVVKEESLHRSQDSANLQVQDMDSEEVQNHHS